MIHWAVFHIMLMPVIEGIPIQRHAETGTFRHSYHIVARFKRAVLDDIADLPAL